MTYLVTCFDRFLRPREISGSEVRDRLAVGGQQVRKFIVLASPGADTRIVIGPPIDLDAVKFPRFYFHKHIRDVAQEQYGRSDVAGGGSARFTVEDIDGVRRYHAELYGKSSDFGPYPQELADDPAASASLEAWYGAPITVA